jgi:adenylate cyclase, class 2
MPLEIEIKLKLDSHEPVRQRLMALHAQHQGTVRETNIFFDRPDGSLRAADSGLRVRLTADVRGPSPDALLTFKGPPAVTGLRSREAFDLHLHPTDQLIPLLKALGFQQQFLFEKDRDSWCLDDCQVELDTLPAFGHFLEIEGFSEESVRAVQAKLGLSELAPQCESYAKMVGEYVRGTNLASSELRFSNDSVPGDNVPSPWQ